MIYRKWSKRFYLMIKRIESLENLIFKDLKKLKDKKYRKKTGTFLIEGERFVGEAIRQGAKIEVIIIDEKVESNIDLSIYNSFDLIIMTSKLYRELAGTVTSQGIMAKVKKTNDLEEITNGSYLYLDGIQDPGNLGTIIRSSHAFNLNGLLLSPLTTDPYSEKALRSSMGSIFRVKIRENVNREELKTLLNNGFKLYITDLKNAREVSEVTFEEKSIIVIGNEGNGVSKEMFDLDHEAILIPMEGGAESLNAGVAASIILYEMSRGKRKKR